MQIAGYARLWLIALLACVIALLYWPSIDFLIHEKWSDTASKTYTHGWLILVICIWLVFRSRDELAAAPARFSPKWLVGLAAAVVAWLVCYRASIEGLELPLLPLIFWLAVTVAFGVNVGRLLLFPVAFFYFAVPIWYGTPLKNLTVLAMHGLFAITGPPTLFEGDYIHIPNGTFVIEEGCSGLHFMIVGLAVAALYGEQRRDPWRIRVRQLALMAGLAVLANWVRVYTVIQAGYLTDMQSYLVRVSHYGFGWCVFAAALLVFFWLAPRLGPDLGLDTPRAVPPPAYLAVTRAELAGLASVVAILAALPALSAGLRIMHPAPRATDPVDPGATWHALPQDLGSAWRPVFPAADQQERQALINAAGDIVETLTVSYRTQRQGAELVGEGTSIVGGVLELRAERVVSTPSGTFREAEVADPEAATGNSAAGRSLIWWRYEVAGRTLVAPFAEQLWYGINALVWQPPAGLTAMRTSCRGDCAGARRTLREFIASSNLAPER
jgi:exosortase